MALRGTTKPKCQSRSSGNSFSAVNHTECAVPKGEATASLNFTRRGDVETPVPRSSCVVSWSQRSRSVLRRMNGTSTDVVKASNEVVVHGCGTTPMVYIVEIFRKCGGVEILIGVVLTQGLHFLLFGGQDDAIGDDG